MFGEPYVRNRRSGPEDRRLEGKDHLHPIAFGRVDEFELQIGWGLWAAIQAKISTIDFDFWGWAIERWGQAVEKMEGEEFQGWLEEVAG